jgi:hypothetical protein
MVALLAALILSLSSSPAQANPLTFRLPVPQDTCYLGCRFNGLGCYQADLYHTAQDYLPNEGQGPLDVLATADGVVAAIFPNIEDHGMGNALLLRHLLRSGGEIFSLYGHLKSVTPGLEAGDEVFRGEAIGLMGQSGFGDPYFWNRHLHFELKSAPTLGDPVSETYEGYTPSPAQDWGYFNPTDYIDKVEFVPLTAEVVSQPAPPAGPASVGTNEAARFESGGAACNYGHEIQYRFDWGDGSGTGWLAEPEASHAWTAKGVYTLSVRARCAEHPEVVSAAATASVEVRRPSLVFAALPAQVTLDEGRRLELEVAASDPLGDTVTIGPEGGWPPNSRLEGGEAGLARLVFWPDYGQGSADGKIYRLGLRASNGETSAAAEVACIVRDVPQVKIFGSSVGEGGGAITGAEDSVRVEFPPGAVGPGTQATAGTAQESLFPSLPEGRFGPVVMLGPPGCEFLAPVRVTLRYGEAGPAGPKVAVYAYDMASGRWQVAPAGQETALDKEAGTLSFETGQAGFFVAAASPPAEDGGGGCFIATAAWGTKDSEQVACLRRMRDERLAPSRAGRWLIGCYYRLSPPAARLLAGSWALRALVRGMLWPLAWAAEAWLRLGAALGWLGIFGLFGWLARASFRSAGARRLAAGLLHPPRQKLQG